MAISNSALLVGGAVLGTQGKSLGSRTWQAPLHPQIWWVLKYHGGRQNTNLGILERASIDFLS